MGDSIVGIITYHNEYNCGATMQAYALQEAINGLGFNTLILNYYFDDTMSEYGIRSVEKDRKLNNEIKELIHRCLQFEKKYKPFPRKVSLIYRIFSYFPITYWVYRYKTDPTVLDWMKKKRKLN